MTMTTAIAAKRPYAGPGLRREAAALQPGDLLLFARQRVKTVTPSEDGWYVFVEFEHRRSDGKPSIRQWRPQTPVVIAVEHPLDRPS